MGRGARAARHAMLARDVHLVSRAMLGRLGRDTVPGDGVPGAVVPGAAVPGHRTGGSVAEEGR